MQLSNVFSMMQMQNTDFSQAQYLAQRGCAPKAGDPPSHSLTEAFARGCPTTPEGVALSTAALAVAARQQGEKMALLGGSPQDAPAIEVPTAPEGVSRGTPGGEQLDLSPAAAEAMEAADRENAAIIQRQMQEDNAHIQSGAWLGGQH